MAGTFKVTIFVANCRFLWTCDTSKNAFLPERVLNQLPQSDLGPSEVAQILPYTLLLNFVFMTGERMKKQFLMTLMGGLIIAMFASGCSKDGGSDAAAGANGCPSGQVKNSAGVCVPGTGTFGTGQVMSWQNELYVSRPRAYKRFLQDINFCYSSGCRGLNNLVLHLDLKSGALPAPARIAMSFDGYWWQYVESATAYPVQGGLEFRLAGTPYPNPYAQDMYSPYQATLSVVVTPLDATANTLEVALIYQGIEFAYGYMYRLGYYGAAAATAGNQYGPASTFGQKVGGPQATGPTPTGNQQLNSKLPAFQP